MTNCKSAKAAKRHDGKERRQFSTKRKALQSVLIHYLVDGLAHKATTT